jgi:hypothetical protein
LRLHELSSTMAEAVERPDCNAPILGIAAWTTASNGDLPEALELQPVKDELGSVLAAAYEAWVSSRALCQHGDSARIVADLQRAHNLADHPSLRWVQSVALLSQGIEYLRRTDAEASQVLGAAIQQFRLASDWLHVWVAVEGAAIHLALRGDPDTAAVIVGYLDRHDRQHSMFVEDRSELSHNSQQSYATETARGAAMTRDEVIQ